MPKLYGDIIKGKEFMSFEFSDKDFSKFIGKEDEFKPRADLKFLTRDRIIKRIVAIVFNWEIKFIEGFHSNYKNLNENTLKLIKF